MLNRVTIHILDKDIAISTSEFYFATIGNGSHEAYQWSKEVTEDRKLEIEKLLEANMAELIEIGNLFIKENK
jgi:hypothetical protein